MQHHQRELRRIAASIRSDEAGPIELRQAAIDLFDLLAAVSGFQITDSKPADEQETILPSGKALSPIDAARCILGHYRTAQYVRGVDAAIREAQRRFPGELVHVLYAGCGPFAPLALTQMPHFSPDEVVFTLIDVHPRSLEVLERIVDRLDLSSYVAQCFLGDATEFRTEAGPCFHVVVIELMQRALENESHVAATINLVSALKSGGLLVPESVRLTAVLANPSREFRFVSSDSGDAQKVHRRDRITLGPLLELDAPLANQLRSRFHESATTLPPATIHVPAHDPGRYSLAVLTEVQVFGDNVIGEYDSGITVPRYYFDLNGSKGGSVEFTYHLGERPGLLGRIM